MKSIAKTRRSRKKATTTADAIEKGSVKATELLCNLPEKVHIRGSRGDFNTRKSRRTVPPGDRGTVRKRGDPLRRDHRLNNHTRYGGGLSTQKTGENRQMKRHKFYFPVSPERNPSLDRQKIARSHEDVGDAPSLPYRVRMRQGGQSNYSKIK